MALKLWDSWEDDLVVADKAAGVWGDTGKIHPARHKGTYFSVEGALNVPRTPQGYPLLVQAGSSEDGKRFAARYAEAVFTAQQTLADAQDFYADLKSRTERAGRNPDHIKILPGIVPVIGSTEAEARAHERVLEDHIVYEHGLNRLEHLLHLEPGTLSRGAAARRPASGGRDRGGQEPLHPRRGAGPARAAHRPRADRPARRRARASDLRRTPEQVADAIEEWFLRGAADGFNIMPAVLPSGLDLFVDHVVPILRDRGLLRREYGPRQTLRERYGLPRPANQYAAPSTTAAPAAALA